MKQQTKTIQDIIKYAQYFIGTPYILWHQEQEEDYFYCDNKFSIQQIKQRGINCAGFINIIRQHSGLTIPSLQNNMITNLRGGTLFWYQYFHVNNLLKQFDYTKNYTIGTLLLRNYRNQQDQGHLAIMYQKNKMQPDKLLYEKIIHAYYDEQHQGQVGVTILGQSHFCTDGGPFGYYQYCIYPQNWLSL